MTRLASVLLREQDQLADQAAIDRERVRRVWWLAKRREQLTLAEKQRASLFDAPPPDRPEETCIYPGCHRPRKMKPERRCRIALCASHAKQVTRKGWVHLSSLAHQDVHLGPDSPCVRGHGGEWRIPRGGNRTRTECLRCRQERPRGAARERLQRFAEARKFLEGRTG